MKTDAWIVPATIWIWSFSWIGGMRTDSVDGRGFVQGGFVEFVGESSDPVAGLVSPVGVRCHSDGRVFVVDDAAHRVVVFSSQGEWLRTLGRRGSAPGELMFPDVLHWDSEGRLYIADAGSNRVQVWMSPLM